MTVNPAHRREFHCIRHKSDLTMRGSRTMTTASKSHDYDPFLSPLASNRQGERTKRELTLTTTTTPGGDRPADGRDFRSRPECRPLPVSSAFGAKLIGTGHGGCVVALTTAVDADRVVASVARLPVSAFVVESAAHGVTPQFNAGSPATAAGAEATP